MLSPRRASDTVQIRTGFKVPDWFPGAHARKATSASSVMVHAGLTRKRQKDAHQQHVPSKRRKARNDSIAMAVSPCVLSPSNRQPAAYQVRPATNGQRPTGSTVFTSFKSSAKANSHPQEEEIRKPYPHGREKSRCRNIKRHFLPNAQTRFPLLLFGAGQPFLLFRSFAITTHKAQEG